MDNPGVAGTSADQESLIWPIAEGQNNKIKDTITVSLFIWARDKNMGLDLPPYHIKGYILWRIYTPNGVMLTYLLQITKWCQDIGRIILHRRHRWRAIASAGFRIVLHKILGYEAVWLHICGGICVGMCFPTPSIKALGNWVNLYALLDEANHNANQRSY